MSQTLFQNFANSGSSLPFRRKTQISISRVNSKLSIGIGSLLAFGLSSINVVQDLPASGKKHFTRLRQCYWICTPINEFSSDPIFQRVDASAEGGLRNAACRCRCREIPRCNQFQVVFEPFEFHLSTPYAFLHRAFEHGIGQFQF